MIDVDGFEISGPRKEKYLERRRADVQNGLQAIQQSSAEHSSERSFWDTIRTMGHQWKGNGSTFGFPEISEWGKTLEQAALSGNVNQARTILEQVRDWLNSKGF